MARLLSEYDPLFPDEVELCPFKRNLEVALPRSILPMAEVLNPPPDSFYLDPFGAGLLGCRVIFSDFLSDISLRE